MDQDHTGFRKKTSRLNVPPNERLCQCCQCPCHDDGPSSKRRKRLRTPPSPSPSPPQPEVFVEPTGGSSHDVFTGSFDTNTRTNTDIHPFEGGFSVFPQAPSSDLQPYLSYESQQYLQQNVGPSNNAVDTSASCTISNDTYSPRSSNRQVLLDTNDCTTQSPNVGNEFPFDGSDDFSPGPGNELLWHGVDANLLTFGGLVGFEAPFVPEPTTCLDNNASPFSNRFPEHQLEREESPFNGLIGPLHEPPWYHPQAIQNKGINRLGNERPHQAKIPMEVLQSTFPQNSKLKELQPSKGSPTTSSTLEWSNTTQGPKSVQPLAIGRPEVKLPPKPGFRKGPLPRETAEHASGMRKYKSCWPCKMMKVQCSFSDPCTRCTKTFTPQPRSSSPPTSPSRHILCYRGPLAGYTAFLFPDHVTSRYSEETVNSLIATCAFTDNKILVEMSSGPNYPVMTLTATEFRCRNDEFLALDYVISNKGTDGRRQNFTRSYAPPIGLDGIRPEDLREECLRHIKCIIGRKRDVGEVNYGDISMITLQTFEAVNNFRNSSPEGAHSPLLRKAVMLYAMNYFMSRITTLTKESAERVVQRLRRPQSIPFEEASRASVVLTSRLLNIQVKQAMQNQLCEMTTKVLKGFEKEMLENPKPQETWADNFCVVLILCMCIEAAQVGSDSRVMTALRKDPTCKLSRSEICQKFDDVPFRQSIHLFHMAYKTYRAKGNYKGKMGFNPIRYGFPDKTAKGITPQSRNLVNEMKRIMADHDVEMAEAVKNPSFDDPKPDLLTHHMAFRKKNSGRLVSKFLLSFFSSKENCDTVNGIVA